MYDRLHNWEPDSLNAMVRIIASSAGSLSVVKNVESTGIAHAGFSKLST